MEVFGAKFTPTARNPRLPELLKTYLYKITPVSTEESSWTALINFGFRVIPTTPDASVVFIIGKSAFVASGRSEAPVRPNLRVATLDTHRLLGEYFPEHQLA
jgi:predicted CoA-binding protein